MAACMEQGDGIKAQNFNLSQFDLIFFYVGVHGCVCVCVGRYVGVIHRKYFKYIEPNGEESKGPAVM